jgi:1-deoxy-D-xylulose-5-phosphate synthase
MDLLKLKGINPTLFDPVFIKPLDSESLFTLLSRHDKVVTLEEHSAHSGMGAILNHFMMQNGFQHIQVLNLGIPETFLEMGSHDALMDEIGLSPEKITDSILHYFTLKKREVVTTLI